MQTILAIDDERSVRESYRLMLSERYSVVLAEDGAKALGVLDKTHVDLVLLDMMMPGMNGAEVLARMRDRGATEPVVVVTASNSVASAVEAMKLGARDYVIKPFDVEALLLLLERILTERRERNQLQALREADRLGFESLIGGSPALMETVSVARRAANVGSTVLITGESGTGKDVIARAIHTAGPRAKEAFVAVSCCAIPPALMESELFGHERGAFTGATESRVGKMQAADQGTLFLDEIGEMPLEAQSKLLRVLQDGRFYPVGSTRNVSTDVRFICATNRDLEACVREGSFRQDLFYRINVVSVVMPPLRQRREDIPALVAHFIAKHAPKVNASAEHLAPDAVARMATYSWPGNVRELENMVERILVHFPEERVVTARHVSALLPDSGDAAPPDGLAEFEGLPLQEAKDRLERHLIERALEQSGHVQSRAAELLGTTRRILKYKMDQLGISSEPEDSAQAC